MERRRWTADDADESWPVASGRDGSPRQSIRGSQLAFAAALTAAMLGTFFSFGGLGYAVTGTVNATHTLKKVATKQKVVVQRSSASDQYAKQKSKQKHVFTPPKRPPSKGKFVTKPNQLGSLPFTGLSLGSTAVASGLLLLLGIMLRRRQDCSS
jgi:hypothetical protein